MTMAKHQATLTAIERARAAVESATARKTALLGRIETAEAEQRTATVAFDAAVMASSADAPFSDHGAAAGLVQAVGATVAALRRGLPDTDAEIASANALLTTAIREDGEARFRVAIEGHLDLAKRVDAVGASYAALLAEWRDSVENITHCWSFGRTMHSHETEQLRNIRAVAWTIPAELQNAIIQTGSPHVQSLEAKTRSVWSQTVRGGLG